MPCLAGTREISEHKLLLVRKNGRHSEAPDFATWESKAAVQGSWLFDGPAKLRPKQSPTLVTISSNPETGGKDRVMTVDLSKVDDALAEGMGRYYKSLARKW